MGKKESASWHQALHILYYTRKSFDTLNHTFKGSLLWQLSILSQTVASYTSKVFQNVDSSD